MIKKGSPVDEWASPIQGGKSAGKFLDLALISANTLLARNATRMEYPGKGGSPKDHSPAGLLVYLESQYSQQVKVKRNRIIASRYSAGYIYLSNIAELKEALAIVKKTGSKFAVRTTGHNPNSGFSSADMTAVPLEEQKLSAIGGRDQQVGLGGFLLGGGMGALPNLYGLGTDGVRNFEVLLADGRLVNANANEHADLYRVLKGGGSNYGIVTRFDLDTHPLIRVQYTINLYNPDDHEEINKATVAVQKAMDKDPKIGLFTNFNNGFVAVGLLYGDISAEPPSAFESFYNLKSLLTTAFPTTNGTLLLLAQAMGHTKVSQKRAIATMTTNISQGLYEEASRWWVFTCEWPQEGHNDAAAQQAVYTMSEKVQSLAEERQLLLDFKCMSFATAAQRVLRSYGPENIRAMQKTAAKYDPEGVFQNLQHGGFLLSNNL
ncbi:hypothetical protein BDV26DRAFT_278900 [Aspergillus bertholletiae]|uniref:FAD-binding PCMH-type domain-containing protein n=1 Tax=Aspergillus bertholletiae TaxID=1226010 RepID=A0A5N7BHV8_9EURO|nr:hypothetical protein BDV26DRAFT_278900 [Aspergillus bertholletiae]